MRPRALELPRFLEASLAAGHPWVYRDHVPPDFEAAPGTLLRIRAGSFQGFALWDATSQIALRIYSTREPPSPAWVAERVAAAWELREPLREARTSAYRWIFGEGDGLPGITVDLYGPWAVVALYAEGLDELVGWLIPALRATTKLRGILVRGRGDEGRLNTLWGREPPEELVVEEHGVRLAVDLRAGQKTGLFLDQRDNRLFTAGLARGRRVLNLFAYTGAFSIHAALAGASHVTSVEISAGALETARSTFRLNGVDPDAHGFVRADVLDFLTDARRHGSRWDLVITDPPSFARSKRQLGAALKAYTRLNAAGLGVTQTRGLYAAASCTSQVDPGAFRQTLAASAAKAKRRLQIIHEAGQPLDHPVMAQHPEGRYLKFVMGRVLEPE